MDGLFTKPGFAVGMVHLPSIQACKKKSAADIRALMEAAVQDALVLQDSGFDGVMVQNGKDVCPKDACDPFTTALLAQVCAQIRAQVSIPLGISVLKNDAVTALSIAKLCDMQFVRCKVYAGAAVSGEGIVEGCAEKAVACRAQLDAEDIELWSETYDLSSRPLVEMPFAESIRWCKKLGSDSFIVCGRSFEETLDLCRQARQIVGGSKVIIGGGVNAENVAAARQAADGFVVGSAVEKVPFTGPVSRELAEAFIRALRAVR